MRFISAPLFPERTRQLGDELFADEVVGFVDFFFGQGALGGAVGEGVGERLLVGGNLLALGVAEEVEKLDAFQVRGLGGADGLLDLGLRDRLRQHDG